MTDAMTSHNTDLSSWDTLYISIMLRSNLKSMNKYHSTHITSIRINFLICKTTQFCRQKNNERVSAFVVNFRLGYDTKFPSEETRKYMLILVNSHCKIMIMLQIKMKVVELIECQITMGLVPRSGMLEL
jgi:hypothetical protein